MVDQSAASPPPRLSADELTAFIAEIFPHSASTMQIEETGSMTARVRLPVAERHLRPGGTVSGPAMFALADGAFYYAVLTMIGRQAQTVTTSLTINFLRRPPPADLIAEARILKLGKRLATGDVTIYSAQLSEPVAHATVTYAIPQAR